ncbi:MAG: c-type cytochrome [Bdellovibrionota bacterium]
MKKGILLILALSLTACSHVAMLPYLVSSNPHQDISESAKRGKILFAENCATCHGINATGNGELSASLAKAPVNLASIYKDKSLKVFVAETMVGKGEYMPAFKDTLKSEQAWDLANYVASL